MSQATCIAVAVLGFVLSSAAQSNSPKPSTANNDSSASAVVPSSDTETGSRTDGGDRKWRVRLGAVTAGAGYSHGPGIYPGWYGYWPYYGGPDPLWDPYWASYYGHDLLDFSYAHDKGEVKLSGAPKDAKVYIDTAYAGTAGLLKRIWLDPGAYDLAVEIPGKEPFHQRIYVLSGKTVKVAANQPPNVPEKEKP